MDKRIPKFLIEEDVIHLKITNLSHREHALLEFLYCTGCRVGEVQKINSEDVNWEIERKKDEYNQILDTLNWMLEYRMALKNDPQKAHSLLTVRHSD
jgi:integrase